MRLTQPPPPSPPGAPSVNPPSHGARAAAPVRPPWFLFSFNVLVVLVSLVTFFRGSYWVGFFFGSFGGPASLAVFMVEYNKRKAKNTLIDSTPSTLSMVRYLAFCAWASGSLNIFFVVKDLMRPS